METSPPVLLLLTCCCLLLYAATTTRAGAQLGCAGAAATVVTPSTSTTHCALDSIRTMEPNAAAQPPTPPRQLRPKKELPKWLLILIPVVAAMLGVGGLLTYNLRCCNNNLIEIEFSRLPRPEIKVNNPV